MGVIAAPGVADPLVPVEARATGTDVIPARIRLADGDTRPEAAGLLGVDRLPVRRDLQDGGIS
jgi:hypothetical protein